MKLPQNLPTNIQLKNVKHAKFASEETNCFEASVYIDGVKEGTVSNEGRGGPDSFWPYSLEEKLSAICETMPPYVSEYGTSHYTPEILIGEYFTQYQLEKVFKSHIKTHWVLICDDKVMQIKKKPGFDLAAQDQAYIDAFKKRQNVAHILNMLPANEALALYVKHMV